MDESTRKITVKSGKHEVEMEVTSEQYSKYYRPWWVQKKKEQRNRDAKKEKGYKTEFYETWNDAIVIKDNDFNSFQDSLEEIVEKKMTLELLNEALNSLLPDEKEIAINVISEEVSLSKFARMKNAHRTTLSDKKKKVLKKLKAYFSAKGYVVS